MTQSDYMKVSHWIDRLTSEIIRREFSGFDPYAGLLFVPALIRRPLPLLGKRAVVQIGKLVARSYPPKVSRIKLAKTKALVAPALPTELRHSITSNLLEGRWQDGAWGYEFDVAVRWGEYPASASNTVVTAFVTDSLPDCYDTIRDGVLTFLDSAFDCHGFFRYSARPAPNILNANALGAYTWHRLGGDPQKTAEALSNLTPYLQGDAWPYGISEDLVWDDAYHSSYILWALKGLQSIGAELPVSLEQLHEHWINRYYDSKTGIIFERPGLTTLHNTADCLWWLTEFESSKSLDRSLSVARQLTQELESKRLAQLTTRWDIAHALRALAHLRSRLGVDT